MSEHTPGPWRVEVDDQSGIGRTHAVYVCSAAEWPEGQLARVNVQDGMGEREANARLIAAAPDLLVALEWMVANDDTNEGDEPIEHLGGRSWNEVNDYWITGLNAARIAIARARGTRP